MENSLKGLMLAAGTVITCLVIGLGFYIAREAKDTASIGATQIRKLNAEFSESDKIIYDGLIVSGYEVANVLNKFKMDNISIKVNTNKTSNEYIKSISDFRLIENNNSFDDIYLKTSDKYINPNAQFLGEIIRDENKTIIGIVFTQNE